MRLVAYGPEHVAATQAWLDDPAIMANTPIPEPVPEDHAAGWLTRFAGDPEKAAWAVLDDDDQVVAFACAPLISRERAEAELGYSVAGRARGQGIATWVLGELTTWALGEGVQRIELHINNENTASQRVAERNGYVLEGVLRQTYLKPGRRVDTAVWSLLATDPNALERRPEGA
jgi:RimJ/RimL family protein N-acetyltransferase